MLGTPGLELGVGGGPKFAVSGVEKFQDMHQAAHSGGVFDGGSEWSAWYVRDYESLIDSGASQSDTGPEAPDSAGEAHHGPGSQVESGREA